MSSPCRWKVRSCVSDGINHAGGVCLLGAPTEERAAQQPSRALDADDPARLRGLTTVGSGSTLTLKRGKNQSMELWLWHDAVLMGDIMAARKSCSLVMYNYDGAPVARYHLEHAWPAKLEVSALKAGASEVLMETVTIVCEHIQRVNG